MRASFLVILIPEEAILLVQVCLMMPSPYTDPMSLCFHLLIFLVILKYKYYSDSQLILTCYPRSSIREDCRSRQ
jgi:hypothetical protein